MAKTTTKTNSATTTEIKSEDLVLTAKQCTQWLHKNCRSKLLELKKLNIDVTFVEDKYDLLRRVAILVRYNRDQHVHDFYFFPHEYPCNLAERVARRDLPFISKCLWIWCQGLLMPLYRARESFMQLNGSKDWQCTTDLTADSDEDRSAWVQGDYFARYPKDYRRYYSAAKLMNVSRAYTAYSEMAKRMGGVCHAVVTEMLNTSPCDLQEPQICAVVKQKEGWRISATLGYSSSNLEFNYIGAMSWTELQKQYSVSRDLFEIAESASSGDAREALRHCIDAEKTKSMVGEFTHQVDCEMLLAD